MPPEVGQLTVQTKQFLTSQLVDLTTLTCSKKNLEVFSEENIIVAGINVPPNTIHQTVV